MIDHLLQSTLFAVLAGLLAVVLRENKASVRHALWLVASLKFLVPFRVLAEMGRTFSWRIELPAVAPPPVAALLKVRGPVPQVPADFVGAVASPAIAGVTSTYDLTSIALGLWLTGCVVSFLVWAVRWRRIAALAAAGTPISHGREVEALQRLESDGRRRVDLVLVDSFFEPGVFGIVRPVLMWPSGISARLEDEHVEAVLAHEIAHVERRDNLWAAVHTLVQSIFWFHPLVWWIGARLVTERERACDEAVVRRGSKPHVYAEGILRTCEHFVEAPLPCVAGVTADLKMRLAAIVTGVPGLALSRGRRLLLTAVASLAVVAPLAAGAWQGAPAATADAAKIEDPLPKFEVASVKQNPTGNNEIMIGLGASTGRYNASNIALSLLIRSSYLLQDIQIVGGPDWINTDRWDIVAKAESAVSRVPPGQVGPMQLMVRSLLADRFKLVVHRETREMPIYALVLAREDKRLGPQLKESTADCTPGARGGVPPPAPPAPGERPLCGMRMAPGNLSAGGTPLSQLATTLSNSVGRTVVDRTGLMARYDFNLKWTPDGLAAGGGPGVPGGAPEPGGPPPADLNGPSIFAAVQEQLGLKLESQHGPVEVLIIDSAERPSED